MRIQETPTPRNPGHTSSLNETQSGSLCTGCWRGEPLQTALEYGAAHGAFAMATKAEVIKLAGGGNARVDR